MAVTVQIDVAKQHPAGLSVSGSPTKMMRKGKRRSAAVYVAAVVILTCHLVQMIDCHRLKKTEGRSVAKTTGFQKGEIVFGRVSEEGSGLASQTLFGSKKSSSNASVEDEAAYQADSAGWSKEQTHDTASREALWKRMASSLQCGGDQLRFRAVGPGASHFAVEQGHAPPLPLSQVPSACGYSMQRNPFALVLLVPYDGCNMVHEGGHHVLPMQWHGVPVSLWCPETPHGGIHHTSKKPGVSDPDTPPSHFFPPNKHYPQYPFLGLPEQMPTKKPDVPIFPQYSNLYPPQHHFPSPLPAATTPPQMFPLPVHPPYFPPFPWPYSGPLPATTVTSPQLAPYLPFVPPFPPFIPQYPQYPTSGPRMTFPTKPPLTQTTWDRYHFHPHFPFIPQYPQYPTSGPRMTFPTKPPLTRPTWDHYHFHPHLPFIPQYPQYTISGPRMTFPTKPPISKPRMTFPTKPPISKPRMTFPTKPPLSRTTWDRYHFQPRFTFVPYVL